MAPCRNFQTKPTRIKSRRHGLRSRRSSGLLADELRNMILFGALDGRTRLPPEPDLAGHLRVSRHQLREALRLLEQDGLVKVRAGRNGGIFLTVPTVDVLTRSFAGILARDNALIVANVLQAADNSRPPRSGGHA